MDRIILTTPMGIGNGESMTERVISKVDKHSGLIATIGVMLITFSSLNYGMQILAVKDNVLHNKLVAESAQQLLKEQIHLLEVLKEGTERDKDILDRMTDMSVRMTAIESKLSKINNLN